MLVDSFQSARVERRSTVTLTHGEGVTNTTHACKSPAAFKQREPPQRSSCRDVNASPWPTEHTVPHAHLCSGDADGPLKRPSRTRSNPCGLSSTPVVAVGATHRITGGIRRGRWGGGALAVALARAVHDSGTNHGHYAPRTALLYAQLPTHRGACSPSCCHRGRVSWAERIAAILLILRRVESTRPGAHRQVWSGCSSRSAAFEPISMAHAACRLTAPLKPAPFVSARRQSPTRRRHTSNLLPRTYWPTATGSDALLCEG